MGSHIHSPDSKYLMVPFIENFLTDILLTIFVQQSPYVYAHIYVVQTVFDS